MSIEMTIYQPWGGLGDNLAHSIIPELCKATGNKCYLSKHNAHRNQQIYDLVWGLNPFLEKEQKDSKDLSWLDKCGIFENLSFYLNIKILLLSILIVYQWGMIEIF